MVDYNSYETAYLGGGCFWCVEAVFLRIKGVIAVESGYMGGKTKDPSYKEICTGSTGHAEIIKVIFDPKKINYRQILEIFFISHDPTTKDRQGNDVGSQYRSHIFYIDASQKKEAEDYIASIQTEFNQKIVTLISAASTFYAAEDYHQNYYDRNSQQPYCQVVIGPKLKKLKLI